MNNFFYLYLSGLGFEVKDVHLAKAGVGTKQKVQGHNKGVCFLAKAGVGTKQKVQGHNKGVCFLAKAGVGTKQKVQGHNKGVCFLAKAGAWIKQKIPNWADRYRTGFYSFVQNGKKEKMGILSVRSVSKSFSKLGRQV